MGVPVGAAVANGEANRQALSRIARGWKGSRRLSRGKRKHQPEFEGGRFRMRESDAMPTMGIHEAGTTTRDSHITR